MSGPGEPRAGGDGAQGVPPLAGKVAIVTGAGGGIGRATAIVLARAGAAIVAVGRTPARLEETLALARDAAGAGAPGPGFAQAADITVEDDMRLMAERTVERLGRIDILVASAGILRAAPGGPRPAVDTPVDEWTTVLRTNLRGTFLSNRAVLGAMMRQKSGDIVNVSSTSGLKGFAYDAAYCASKFAILGMSEALHEEARLSGVRVQTLLPGPVESGIWEQNRPVPPPEKSLAVEQVAETILYLVTLPRDAVLHGPVMVPFRVHRRPAWRAAVLGGVAATRGESA